MSKIYYNQVKKIISKIKAVPPLPAYDSFEWPKLPKDYEYVLVPKGLTLDTWDKLLKNKSNGLWFSGYKDFTGSGWKLSTIYAKDRPLETNITHAESEAKYTLCSVEEYLAFQWLRLEQGLEPVDGKTWSWLASPANWDSGGRPFGLWSPGDGQVRLYGRDAGFRNDLLGVRPSGRGETLESSNLPLDFVIETFTINGKQYRAVEV